MKCKIEISRHDLQFFTCTPILTTLKRSAREHGYSTIWGAIWFTLGTIVDYVLHLGAQLSPMPGVTVWLQRRRGVKTGRNVFIGPLTILDYSYPNFIYLGDNVTISGRNFILTHSVPPRAFQHDFGSYVAPVRIEKDAWIAVGAMVLPGVTIGEGAVVAAGAVVTEDVEPYTLVAGNPARVVKRLTGYNRLSKKSGGGS